MLKKFGPVLSWIWAGTIPETASATATEKKGDMSNYLIITSRQSFEMYHFGAT